MLYSVWITSMVNGLVTMVDHILLEYSLDSLPERERRLCTLLDAASDGPLNSALIGLSSVTTDHDSNMRIYTLFKGDL